MTFFGFLNISPLSHLLGHYVPIFQKLNLFNSHLYFEFWVINWHKGVKISFLRHCFVFENFIVVTVVADWVIFYISSVNKVSISSMRVDDRASMLIGDLSCKWIKNISTKWKYFSQCKLHFTWYLLQIESDWSFEEKSFVKQSMISEWEKCAQKVCFTLTMLHFQGVGGGYKA